MLFVFGSTPWSDFHTATFRLPGFGGAALFLRSQVLPGCLYEATEQQFGVDIGFLTPEQRSDYYQRPAAPNLAEMLSDFFLSAATSEHPEESLPTFTDPVLGLSISVESCSPDLVCLDISLIADPEGDPDEIDGLNFETSRATLLDASGNVRGLRFLPDRPIETLEEW